jgi:hypothetical protein
VSLSDSLGVSYYDSSSSRSIWICSEFLCVLEALVWFDAPELVLVIKEKKPIGGALFYGS